LIKVTSRRKH